MSENGQAVAEFLKGHPRVSNVRYPGLVEDNGYSIAVGQMDHGFGGMLAFEGR